MSHIRDFIVEEEGTASAEIILILAVLPGLLMLFNKQLSGIMDFIFDKIISQAGGL